MTDPIDICAADFISRFFTDISNQNAAANILCKFVFDVSPVFDQERPTTSLNSIADDFYNCIQPNVGSAAIISATKLAESLFYIVILTAVLMILVVVVFGLLDKKQNSVLIISLISFFVIIYIIVGWLLIHNSFLTISNEITNIEQTTDRCVQNAINETETFFADQEAAIDKTLCAYPLECTLGNSTI